MSFQLTFLGYYSIKSLQLKKQIHSVKRRNWSHRERTARDGRRRRTASGGWQLRTAFGGRGSRPPPSDGLGGRPRRTADGRQGGRPWDRRTRPWTSGRVTTLSWHTTHRSSPLIQCSPCNSPNAWHIASNRSLLEVTGTPSTFGVSKVPPCADFSSCSGRFGNRFNNT
jgi:hypothetical protein